MFHFVQLPGTPFNYARIDAALFKSIFAQTFKIFIRLSLSFDNRKPHDVTQWGLSPNKNSQKGYQNVPPTTRKVEQLRESWPPWRYTNTEQVHKYGPGHREAQHCENKSHRCAEHTEANKIFHIS